RSIMIVFFLLNDYIYYSDIHSFTTRRSSDLSGITIEFIGTGIHMLSKYIDDDHYTSNSVEVFTDSKKKFDTRWGTDKYLIDNKRSEEHTSELQSRFDLVCLLLLEKKKIFL